jgi:hypothetical protein
MPYGADVWRNEIPFLSYCKEIRDLMGIAEGVVDFFREKTISTRWQSLSHAAGQQ